VKKTKRTKLVKLNLGCGVDKKLGYINCDIDPKLQPDKIIDLRKKLPFAKESVQEVVLAILKKFFWQPDLLMLYVYGDTSKNGEWGAHKYGYTPKLWRETIQHLGLSPRNELKIDTNYLFTATKQNKSSSGQPIICDSLFQYLLTPWHYLRKKQVIWHVNTEYSNAIGVLLLRPLSRLTTKIVVSNAKAASFVKNILKYSHLRMDTL